MQLLFTGRNFDVTPALKDFTTEKLQRIERRGESINKVNITFHIEKLAHIVEANLILDGKDIHATAEAVDMYAAVDELVDKLIGQITKHKEKHAAGNSHHSE